MESQRPAGTRTLEEKGKKRTGLGWGQEEPFHQGNQEWKDGLEGLALRARDTQAKEMSKITSALEQPMCWN